MDGLARGSQPRIRALLIDGDADTLHMYAEFLQSARCEIDEAEDGREGLAKALSGHPDVVVTEAHLPGLSGFDVCRILHEDAATRDIPVIFVTASAFANDIHLAKAAGADSVLLKPCMPDALAAEILRVVSDSHQLRARSQAARATGVQQPARSTELIARSRSAGRHPASHALQRRFTTEPPLAPPPLVCPSCDRALKYVNSHVGGANIRRTEQWDYFQCPGGCGTFQYRQRTRRLRRV